MIFPELPHVQDEIHDCHIESRKEKKISELKESNPRKITNAGIDCGKEDKSFERILLGSSGRFQRGSYRKKMKIECEI